MQYNDYRALGVTLLSNGLIAYYPQLKIGDAEMMVILIGNVCSKRRLFSYQ